MTMLNSQKINTDPAAPYVVAGYGRRNGKPETWRGEARDDDHAIEQFDAAYPGSDPHTYGQIPRSDYDNNPNPLLVAFREALAHSVTGHTPPELAAAWLEDPWPKCLTPEQIDHARKVLQRLTAL